MKTQTVRQWHPWMASALCAALLAGCGVDGTPAPEASTVGTPASGTAVRRVVVVGDSLADVGSFGAKATIQNSADPAGFPLFPELVARELGVMRQCNFFVYDSVSGSFTTQDGCRNFAVGGSRIVNPALRGGAAVPLNIPTQLEHAVAATGGHWSASDLLLLDGGVNDLADLAVAYLMAGRGGDAVFREFLLQQLDAAVVDPLLATGAPGMAEVGRLYMEALADTYYGAVKAQGLDRGARQVVLLNIPDITLTPRFEMALTVVAENVGDAHAETVRNIFRQWVSAYNATLQARVAGDARVALVDFFSSFTVLVTHAERYGLTNTSQASCPASSVDDLGLRDYTLSTCTSAALDAAPPEGLAAGWWRSWAFADDFHLSPYGHELLAGTIRRTLVETGWW